MFNENIGSGFHLQAQGGFMNEDRSMQGQHNQGYGGGMRNRYGTNNNQDQSRRSKVFTPVTLKMVQQSQPRPDDLCEYDGETINDIIIVGRLLKRMEEPMRTTFEINDNTCTFHVIFYHKGEHQVPIALRNFHYEQFHYVKIYGNIRVFKEEKAIVGMHVKRITNFEEVTNHFLSVFISNCIKKKGILKPRELAMDQTVNHYAQNHQGNQPHWQQNQNYNSHEPMNIDQSGNQSNHYQGGNQYQNNNNQWNNNYNRPNYNNNNSNNNYRNNYNNRGNYSSNNQNYQRQNNSYNSNSNNSNANQGDFNNQTEINDNDLRDIVLQNIQEAAQKNSFIQKQQLRDNIGNKCREDRLERFLNKLILDGQIMHGPDNNSFCLV